MCNGEDWHLEADEGVDQSLRHVLWVGIYADCAGLAARFKRNTPFLMSFAATSSEIPIPCQNEKKRIPLTHRNLAEVDVS